MSEYSILIIDEATAPVVEGDLDTVAKTLAENSFPRFKTLLDTDLVINSAQVISVLAAPAETIAELQSE